MLRTLWALIGGFLLPISVLAQDVGHAVVQSNEPPPLRETGLRYPWEAEPENSPFAAGSTVSFLYGSRILGIANHRADMWAGTIGVGYYFEDNLSINLSFNGIYGDYLRSKTGIDQGDFRGLSGDIMLRYHFLNYGSWSLFVDGGVGVSGMSKKVPVEGTRYNFNPQLGIGLTKELCEGTHLMLGARWYHLSNAEFIDLTKGPFFNGDNPNPGYDGKQVFAGFLFHY